MLSRSRRALVGLLVVALGVLDVVGLLLALRAHNRLRDRTILSVRTRVIEAWPRMVGTLRYSNPPGGQRVVHYAVGSGLASEAEVFTPEGRLILAFPKPSPVSHWPTPRELEETASGSVLTVGPFAPEFRVLSYVSAPSSEGRVVVRLSSEVPELMEDLRERRLQVVGHGATLLILVLAGAMLLAPAGGGEREAAPPSALLAYEEAMARLRDRGHDLEEQIQDKEALARAGELTAGMAHEMRNGLGTILGYARLLERGGGGPVEDAVQAGRSIREECETLETVVRRFMDYVKGESLNPVLFDLRRMLSRVVSRETRGPGAAVEIGAGEMGAVRGDEALLERVFENLVRNAREAAGASGHVKVEVARREDSVVVAVADDGPGMPDEVKSGLRPFFTTKPGGLGLGLALALKLVRLHGGSLGLADRPPRGLVVTVTLPQDTLAGDENRYPS
jgi:signal transduction histidine kinase